MTRKDAINVYLLNYRPEDELVDKFHQICMSTLEVQDQRKTVFKMIHVKDSRSYQWAIRLVDLDFLGLCTYMYVYIYICFLADVYHKKASYSFFRSPEMYLYDLLTDISKKSHKKIVAGRRGPPSCVKWMDGCLVISKPCSIQDLVYHAIEITIYKQMILDVSLSR